MNNTASSAASEAAPHSTLRTAASRPNIRRAMILYAVGSMLGLALAGYELLNARGTMTRTVPPENVATVNQQPILRSDFITQTETETGLPFERTTRADRLRVLDEMISEELKVQRGLELNFAETDQDTRNALSNIVDQQIVAEVATSQLTEQELRDYYQANRANYQSQGQMTVCDLFANGDAAGQPQRATDAVTALRAHMPLATVLQRYQLANRNQCEQNFYFALKSHLGDQLFASAIKLTTGEVTSPIMATDGWHILQVINNTPPVAESFDEARDQLTDDYRNQREARIRSGTMDFLRRRAKMEIAPDYADYHLFGSHQ